MSSEVCIDGLGPLPLDRPASAPEISELVRTAVAGDSALYPVGGGTALNLGARPTKPGRAVSLSALDQVIDYPARDMTITVQAGITIGRLTEILAAENQRLPIDVPHVESATLGGILSVNTSGPRRYGFGTLRDYVLGISAINDQGEEIKGGGRVVKNVAGYDLPKLFVGALGTLGIITQATLKLRPRAEEQAVIGFQCKLDEVESLLNVAVTSRTRPVCMDLLNAAAARMGVSDKHAHDDAWLLLVGFEGQAETVYWQVNQLVQEMKGASSMEVRLGHTARRAWAGLIDLLAPPNATASFKANILPHAVAEFVSAVEKDEPRPAIHAHAGNGIVRGHLIGDVNPEAAAVVLDRWRRLASGFGGRVIVERCPSEWKSRLSVWGPFGSDEKLMKTVKERLDPRRLFNPGRFVDSI